MTRYLRYLFMACLILSPAPLLAALAIDDLPPLDDRPTTEATPQPESIPTPPPLILLRNGEQIRARTVTTNDGTTFACDLGLDNAVVHLSAEQVRRITFDKTSPVAVPRHLILLRNGSLILAENVSLGKEALTVDGWHPEPLTIPHEHVARWEAQPARLQAWLNRESPWIPRQPSALQALHRNIHPFINRGHIGIPAIRAAAFAEESDWRLPLQAGKTYAHDLQREAEGGSFSLVLVWDEELLLTVDFPGPTGLLRFNLTSQEGRWTALPAEGEAEPRKRFPLPERTGNAKVMHIQFFLDDSEVALRINGGAPVTEEMPEDDPVRLVTLTPWVQGLKMIHARGVPGGTYPAGWRRDLIGRYRSDGRGNSTAPDSVDTEHPPTDGDRLVLGSLSPSSARPHIVLDNGTILGGVIKELSRKQLLFDAYLLGEQSIPTHRILEIHLP